jgi:ribonuclease P protein component
MLTRSHRLTSSVAFAQTVRRGRRAGAGTLVLHVFAAATSDTTRIGFVVSKAVGNAVVRNRVKRRLREVARGRLGSLPECSTVVVRALPAAAHASYDDLQTDFDAALARTETRPAGAGRSR